MEGEIRKRKANWIGHILRRNCLLKQVIEGKIQGEMEVARRRGRRRKKLPDDLNDRWRYTYLKEEALDRTMWRHRFGGGFGLVVRQNTEWMNEWKEAVVLPCTLLSDMCLKRRTEHKKRLRMACASVRVSNWACLAQNSIWVRFLNTESDNQLRIVSIHA